MNRIKFQPMPRRSFILEDLFDEFFTPTDGFFNPDRTIHQTPLANVFEEKDHFGIDLAIPGLQKEQVEIRLDKDQLIISANLESPELPESTVYTRKEFWYGHFEKRFHLPETVDKEGIQAGFTDGVLHIELKKREEAIDKGPKQIQIN